MSLPCRGPLPAPSPSPASPTRTLLFTVRDDHADTLVAQLRAALEAEYGPQPTDLVQKITGRTDKPLDRIKAFKNDPHPKYVVTVDLLTTGGSTQVHRAAG